MRAQDLEEQEAEVGAAAAEGPFPRVQLPAADACDHRRIAYPAAAFEGAEKGVDAVDEGKSEFEGWRR